MKILITGSNGFVGRNIAKELIGGNYIIGCGTKEKSVIEVDDYIQWDIADEEIPKKLSDMKIDIIIHAAASLDRDDGNERLVKVNCMGTHRIYTLARKISVKKVIYLSSIPIIGKPGNFPIKESTEVNPITMYHATKAAGEYILNQLIKDGIHIIHLRITSPVGPGMPVKTIVPIFLNRALNGENIILSGKGNRRQNYIDVRDIGRAVRKLINNSIPDGVYNVASKNTISNYELAEMCTMVTGSASEIVFSNSKDLYDDWVWDVDISKLTKVIGDFNKHSIKESLTDIAGALQGER